jgi:hypothetical protein
MTDSVFLADGELFTPTDHARGPWDPGALHGGAPAALIAAAFERIADGSELQIARLGFDFLRPIPFAPLELSTRILRSGRRVQELTGELHAEGKLVARASALRVRAVPVELPVPAPAPGEGGAFPDERALPGPANAKATRFTIDGSSGASFAATAMEMRMLTDPYALGPGRVWMRLRHPLLPGQPLTPLTRLVATADFGNGVGAALPFDRFLFINADLTIHLRRPPRGDWIGLDARTLLHAGGTGLAESLLHDENGLVGRAFQTLVVQPR